MEVWVNAQIYPMPLRYMSSLFSHNINKWHHGVFLLIMILMNTHINIYRILPRCLPKQNDHVWADLRMLRHTSDRWHRVQMCHWLHAKCTENAAFRADQTQTRCFSKPGDFHTHPFLHTATSMSTADRDYSGSTWTLWTVCPPLHMPTDLAYTSMRV